MPDGAVSKSFGWVGFAAKPCATRWSLSAAARENSEYKAALERQSFVQARLGQLRERLSKLASIDMTQIPTDKVGLGSKVVVQDEKTGTKETYNLVFGDALEFDESQVTMASPIGRALLGKAKGEVAYLKLPTMVRQLKVVDLRTIHDQ